MTLSRVLTLILGALLTCCMADAAASEETKDDLLIRNITVIDAVSGKRIEQDVLLRNGRIESLKAAAESVPEGLNVLDGTGKYLLPGLWDAHVHFTYEQAVSPVMLSLFLAHGITQVRDTGGQLDAVVQWKQRAASQPYDAPRVFIAGPLLDGIPTVYDGSSQGNPKLALSVADVSQAEAVVDQLAIAGVDLIKVYEMLQADVFAALMNRADQHGLVVAGHVPLALTAADASNAGLDSIEHLRNLELGCSDQEEAMIAERREMLNNAGELSGSALRGEAHGAHRYRSISTLNWDRCEQLLELMRSNKTLQVPTLALTESFFLNRHSSESWRASFDYLPAEIRSSWLENSEQMADFFASDPEGAGDRAAYLEWMHRVVAWMADDGMLMAGTDTPIFFMTPGASLHWELNALVNHGLTPMQAIEAATLTPARFFGLENEMGSIAAGMNADLVLLDADPLSDIQNTQRINAVIRAGHLHNRDELDQLLKESASH